MTNLLSRRAVISAAFAALSARALIWPASAQPSKTAFAQWVEAFRVRAKAHGISDATYTRVMASITPDTSVYELNRSQPEFKEPVWQYLNRRVSDWRVMTGKQRAADYAPLFDRIERDYGVDRYILLGIWGMESAFGEVVADPAWMRPVLPALAALAWGEPRRRVYWEQELLNALLIVERGWAAPKDMIGSWAGAMGHTQWMPDVWLTMGVDYNRDGRISPFGPPDDALAGTAQYLLKQGRYRRGEGWGYEVETPSGMGATGSGMRAIQSWTESGVRQANGRPFPRPQEQARLWQPVAGGPVLLLAQNFKAIKSYDPADTYALAVGHLGDRIRGDGPFVHQFPGGERALTVAEIKDMQQRLTALGFDTGRTDGRVAPPFVPAIRAFQRKTGITPEDGYPGLKVLAALRGAAQPAAEIQSKR